MDLIIISFLIIMAIVLLVLIIKENIAYKKELDESINRDYDSRLKNELDRTKN